MKNRTLPDILTPAEEQALLSVFNCRYPTQLRNRTMILLALNTGMRISDLIKLKWSDIELDTGRCHVKQGKGRKDRVIFVKPDILSAMIDTVKKQGRGIEGLCFVTTKGDPIQTAFLRRMIGERAAKAGITKRVHFHLLRHTYLTRLYGRTKDLRLVQLVAGHASSSTTEIYTHLSGADIKAAMLETDGFEDPDPKEMAEVIGAMGKGLPVIADEMDPGKLDKELSAYVEKEL